MGIGLLSFLGCWKPTPPTAQPLGAAPVPAQVAQLAERAECTADDAYGDARSLLERHLGRETRGLVRAQAVAEDYCVDSEPSCCLGIWVSRCSSSDAGQPCAVASSYATLVDADASRDLAVVACGRGDQESCYRHP